MSVERPCLSSRTTRCAHAGAGGQFVGVITTFFSVADSE
jgi:hypothetical protein